LDRLRNAGQHLHRISAIVGSSIGQGVNGNEKRRSERHFGEKSFDLNHLKITERLCQCAKWKPTEFLPSEPADASSMAEPSLLAFRLSIGRKRSPKKARPQITNRDAISRPRPGHLPNRVNFPVASFLI
jgi:hypothetical protein